MRKISQKTIEKFKEGDKDSFEDIFYYYKDKVYYFAYHYVKDQDDADDCVQEVFIKLVNSIDTYDFVSCQFETWFYLLSKRVILNFLRTQSRHRNHYLYDEEIIENYAEKDFTELQHTLYDLEDLMGKKMYTVFILRVGYKLTFDLIYEIADIPRETARRLYNQSQEVIKEYIGEEEYEKRKEFL